MAGRVVRRIAGHVALAVIASLLGYVLASVTLDPRARYLGRHPRPSRAAVDHALDRLGTNPDQSLFSRTVHWFTGVLHGNFGLEYTMTPVLTDLRERSLVSLQLLLIGSILGAVLGVALGVWGATRQYRLDDTVAAQISYLLIATPVFVLAVLLMMVATWFNHLVGHDLIVFTGQYSPGITGTWPQVWDRGVHLLLPTLCLTLVSAASYSRYQRSAMLDVLSSDHLRTARAKGLTRQQAVWRHGVRIALIPMSTYLAYGFGTLLAGSTLLEVVFSWHGMGELAITSIQQNDVNAVAGVICYVTLLVLASSILAEICQALLDPRARQR